jgi:serine/threonine protein kinase/Flp pilus assembly protein TadD
MSQNQPAADQIYLAALEQETPEKRGAFLDEACGTNRELRQRVERLLEAQLKAGEFLELPAADVLATDIRPVTEHPGDVIGPYKLLQQIGEGGMGTVFMAEQTEPVERRVALKIIKPGMDTQQVIVRFEAERQALAMMDHPNIAKVLDGGTTDSGRPYFVMELVKGIPITDYCDEQHLTPKARLELFIPICQAVQHAHQKGIIHRDLKPSNILVAQYDGKPVPKVIDFGVAKAISHKLTEKTMFTQYGQIVGTVEYMSPEQAQLNQLDVDTRSDVYSLGVLLYELLTGETPFDKQRLRSAAFDELLRIIRDEEPPRPSLKLSSSQSLPSIAANRHIDPYKLSMLVRGELDWIVMRALEKDRNRRYETPSQFAEDVQHYLNDEAVTACPPSTAYRFKKFAKRNKTIIGTTAAIAASLIIGSTVAIWQAIEADKERDRAVVAEGKAAAEAERANKEAQRADAEVDKARTEAAIAKAVNDFLNTDLLGMTGAAAQVEAEISPDPNIKLRTLLDRAAENIVGQFPDQPLVKAAIHYSIGNSYRSIGAYKEAEKHLRRALELGREELGNEHSATLSSMNDLAVVFRNQGRFSEAEDLHRQTLEIRRRTLGTEHPQTLDSLHNLATVYSDQGRYAEAEQLDQQTLSILRDTLGDEHPQTLDSKNNLAYLFLQQGRFAESEALHQQNLEILRRTLGDEHPATLLTMYNLANVYVFQGRFTDAEKKHHEILELRRRILGDEHPRTLHSMNCLANVYRNQGRYKEAEESYQQTLETQRRILGHEHPDTLHSMNSLAILYCNQGRYKDAVELHQQTLEIQRRTLGNDHPDTLNSMNNLANVYRNQGRFKEAEELYQHTLEIHRRKLGDEHPGTLLIKNNLAIVYLDLGRYDDSENLQGQTLEIQRRKLGDEHPDTLGSMNNLANIYHAQGRYPEAERLERQCLDSQRRVFGPAHAHVVMTANNLVQTLGHQEKWDEVISLCRETLEANDESGALHKHLGYAFEKSGDIDAAVAEYRRAIELDPTDDWLIDALVRVLKDQDRKQELLVVLTELIDGGVESHQVYRFRGQVYVDGGQWVQAIQDLNKAKKLYEGSTAGDDRDLTAARIHRYLGYALERSGDLEGAIMTYRKAVELDPDDNWSFESLARVLRHLGQARFRKQDWSGAVESWGKAIELGRPVDPRTAFQLAICYEHLTDKQQAAEWYSKGVTLMEEMQTPEESLAKLRQQAEQLLGLATPQTVKN